MAKTHAPSAGDLGLIPGQGTRSHPHAVTKTQCNQINIFKMNFKKGRWHSLATSTVYDKIFLWPIASPTEDVSLSPDLGHVTWPGDALLIDVELPVLYALSPRNQDWKQMGLAICFRGCSKHVQSELRS